MNLSWFGQRKWLSEKQLVYATVSLVSSATILLELIQTRILSFIFWYYVVYLTIAIALLGFGISGTLVSIFADRLVDRNKALRNLLLAFAGTTFVSLLASYLQIFFGNDLSLTGLLKVVFLFVMFLLPFVFAGAILNICLSSPGYQVGKLYAADLLSAGLACVAFFFLLPLLGPYKLIGLITCSMTFLANLWIGPVSQKSRLASLAMAILGFLTIIFASDTAFPLIPQASKEYVGHLAAGAQIEKTIWTPMCRLDVIGLEGVGASEQKKAIAKDPALEWKIITQDGTAHTVMASLARMPSNAQSASPVTTKSLAYTIKEKAIVGIIGVGGGWDVLTALKFGAQHITAAELNPFICALLKHDYADYTGHFVEDPRVTILNEEGRSMLRQVSDKFDVIQMQAIDTFAAQSTGAYTLSENYLHTTEAFQEMLSHLKPDGIFSVGRLELLTPPCASLRLASLACEALKRQGKLQNIDKQLFVCKDQYSTSLILVKNAPFNKDEFNTLLQAAKNNDIDIFYFPKLLPHEEQIQLESEYYKSSSPKVLASHKAFDGLISAYIDNKQNDFFQNYGYLVEPTTDDSPFFFLFNKKNFSSLFDFGQLFNNVAILTLYIVLVESIVFILAAIFWPLYQFNRQGLAFPHAFTYSTYFAAVGVGFMLIEIGLIQKCVLFLGSPLYALSVILATLLISAGIGSGLVSKLNWKTQKVMTVFGGLFMILMISLIFVLNTIFYSLLHLPFVMRILAVCLLIFPSGVLMGTFFPTGLQSVQKKEPRYLSWAWGINGCASVLGSFAAIVLAMFQGFTFSLLVGIFAYLLAIWAAFRFSNESSSSHGTVPELPYS